MKKLFLAAVCVFLFCTCQNQMDGGASTGTIVFSVSGSAGSGSGRYIIDHTEVEYDLHYEIEIKGTSTHTISGKKGDAPFAAQVPTGHYTVTVDVTLDDLPYGSGGTTVEVIAGQTAEALVTVTRVNWTYAWTVTFENYIGPPVSSISGVQHRDPVTEPTITTTVTDSGVVYNFDAWYKEATFENEWDFAEDTVKGDTTLYAKWINTGLSLNVGDNGPGGGIIFYRYDLGFTVDGYGVSGDPGYFAAYTAYYLEAAPVDQSTGTQWGNIFTLISGVTTFLEEPPTSAELVIGNGRKDTQLIVAHMSSNSITGTAAQLCAGYSGGGETDWFLPSYGELNKLYKSSLGIMTADSYWSSSQLSSTAAWYQIFSNGNWGVYSKSKTYYVRAVRAF